MQANRDVREAIKNANLFQWQVADKVGVHEVTFTKRLRKELPAAKKSEIFKAIDELSRKEG